MRKYAFDAALHFAALASVQDSANRPERYYHNNATHVQTRPDACVSNGVRYFAFFSTSATFGEFQYASIDEKHPQLSINPYGTTKPIGEKMLADYEHACGLRYCVFRYFCAAGDSKDGKLGEEHNSETHLIPAMIKAVMSIIYKKLCLIEHLHK